MRTLEQGRTIEDLENTVNKLAKSKHKTSAELHDLRSELEMTEANAREKKAQSSQTVQQLNRELQTTKQALEESRVREKQVRKIRKMLFIHDTGGSVQKIRELPIAVELMTFWLLVRIDLEETMVSVLHKELEYKVEKLKNKKVGGLVAEGQLQIRTFSW